MSETGRRSLAGNSLIMIVGQIAVKILSFFLPFTRPVSLESSNSANSVLRCRWWRFLRYFPNSA